MTGPSEQNDNQTALAAGTRIQHFELIKTLGRGGFGITYLAMDKKRNRKVVLKEYFPASAAIRGSQQTQVSLLTGAKQHDFNEGLRRFQREALILSEFKHPNIVEVIALFEANGTAYFVMEYIDGQSLQDLVEQRQRPLTEAEIHKDLLPVLNGLAALHAQDLLHLDIKPDNILTSDYGEPLLIDFGGARYATSQASQDHSSMVATLGYAPTEQYSLKPVQTEATDLYAFGMTLYHLMAPQQELPASGDRRDALQEDMPDPLPAIRSIATGYPDAFYRVVEHCTQTAKKDRPQTVAEVQALLPELEEVPITPPPVPEPPTPVPTPEPQKTTPTPAPEPSPVSTSDSISAPTNKGQTEPEKPKSPWLAIVVAVVVLVGGGFGFQQYQLQQEQQRILGLVGKLVRIPAGSFKMGSNNGRDAEKPVHRVNISGFYMMEHEVTKAAFAAFVEDTGHLSDGCWVYGDGWKEDSSKSWQSPGFSQSKQDPVVCVNWKDATAFAKWLSRKTGKTFRLPSESEWEYAARAGSTTKYSWGDSIDCSKAQYNGGSGSRCYYKPNGNYRGTAKVKSYAPNDFGLYDMHGNVYEWVQDCWNDHYNNGPYNNRARESGDCGGRVLRGGSWLSKPTYLRSANRFKDNSSSRYLNYGFRLVQAP